MSSPERLQRLAALASTELREHILPYWFQTMDPRGGFAGYVADDGTPDFHHPKGLVMHSRHLWCSSSAYLERRNPLDLRAARHAYAFLTGPLRDPGLGFWWTVNAKGKPDPTFKLLYGQAFAVYSLSRYFQATGDQRALDLALETFALLEGTGRDREFGGYYEAVDRRWNKPVVKALSEVDIPCAKSMNTNLHVLEAFTALFVASGRADVREALESLLDVFESRILVSPEHVGVYFDRDWKSLTTQQSYGHDIEASWLLTEAAQTLYGHDLPAAKREIYLAIARKSLRLVREHGALPNEFQKGHLDTNRIWWVQAEALVGLVNAWELSGDEAYLEGAETVWSWIDQHQADREQGEWFWAVAANGTPDRTQPKGGLWKTSYHNGRACLEVMQRARRAQ